MIRCGSTDLGRGKDQPLGKRKDLLFNTGYRTAVDDMQDDLIRNSRTETIDSRIRLIVTEDTIETIYREMRKRCK